MNFTEIAAAAGFSSVHYFSRLFKEKTSELLQMLQDLSGNKHKVITSICVLSEDEGVYKEQVDFDVAEVYFKEISKKQ